MRAGCPFKVVRRSPVVEFQSSIDCQGIEARVLLSGLNARVLAPGSFSLAEGALCVTSHSVISLTPSSPPQPTPLARVVPSGENASPLTGIGPAKIFVCSFHKPVSHNLKL